ncbi:MAG: hypothetical protein SNJ70_08105 [Armatimonadota bacterium]
MVGDEKMPSDNNASGNGKRKTDEPISRIDKMNSSSFCCASRPPYILISFILLFVLAGILAWNYYINQQTPEITAEKFITYTLNGDIENAKLYVSKSSKNKIDSNKIKEYLHYLKNQNIEFKIKNVEYSDDDNTAIVTILAKDYENKNDGYSFDIVLIREFIKWKVEIDLSSKRLINKVSELGLVDLQIKADK